MTSHSDNHIDDPRKFERCRCPLCKQCWRHIETGRCIYAGPFVGYAEATRQPRGDEQVPPT